MEPTGCVWVVEVGQYSDRRVVGVCSTHERAQAMRDQWPDEYERNGIQIKAWHLDESYQHVTDVHYKPYEIRMYRNGEMESIVEQDRAFVSWFYTKLYVWTRSRAKAKSLAGLPDCITGTVWATDETHAIKIANEWRVQSIVNGEWDKKER